ncbi:LLM class flavin-dependent oxidoreductase [Micromonosporaceae bacterium Da 78-11]
MIRRLLVALSALTLLAACGGSPPESGKVSLTLGDQANGLKTLFEASGALDGASFGYKWAEFQGAAPLFQAMQSDNVDTGYAADIPTLQAISGGLPIKFVAAAESNGQGTAILLRKDSPVKSVADLKGREILVSSARGSIADYLLANVLQKAGLKYGDVTVKYALPTAAQAAFSSGKVEIWAIFGVFQATAVAGGAKVLIDGRDGGTSGIGVLSASDASLGDPKKKAAIGDFLQRLAKAEQWSATHADEYAKIYSEKNGVPLEVAKVVVSWGSTALLPVDDKVVQRVQPVSDLMNSVGVLPTAVKGHRPRRHQHVPGGRVMTVEFISAISPHPTGSLFGFDHDHARRYARALDDGGFDYTLVAYHSSAADANQLAQFVVDHTDRLKPMLAHRPGVVFPTHAARTFATLDRISKGRLSIHIISGGSDAEQRREGDYLDKAARYERSDEYIQILRRAWSATEPFSHQGKYFRFEDFHSDVLPYQGTIPVSVGGSSEDAYRVGGQQGDIFGLWGEPLAETKQQIDAVNAYADAAGRPHPRIWVSFRPIIAATDELAWAKAHRILTATTAPGTADRPANVGSQRLLDLAARGELHDRALWTPLVTATNAAGSSTALVGSPETVAAALLDYIDIGCELLSIRGYDPLNDAIDYARFVLPLVRQELAHRGIQ